MSPLVGYLMDRFGARGSFACCLVFAVLGTLLFLAKWRFFPDEWTQKKIKRSVKHPFALFFIPRVRNVLLVSGIVSMAWDIQNFMFPVYGHAIGLSSSQIGWLIGSFFAACLLVRFLMPWLSRHFSEWTCLTLVLLIGGICYAIIPLVTSLPWLLLLAFILGLGIGSSQPNVMTLLHSESPEGRVGEAIGVRTMLQTASHSFLPSVFGAVTAFCGTLPIFWCMAVLMGGCAWLTKKAQKEE